MEPIMKIENPKTIVNCWNEWDPLKRVIVGVPDGCMIAPSEPAVECKVPIDSDMKGEWGPRPQHTVDAANEQLNYFVKQLEKRGVEVHRPIPINFNQPVKTPDFETQSMFGCCVPRDTLAPVGNELLEATMSYRCRWFEYLCTRPLIEKWYKQDPNMRWEAAPKPRLTDRSYKPGYLQRVMTIEDRLKLTAAKDFVTTEEEPLFDAAELARCGKDIIVQHGFTANEAGIDWLRRHFSKRGMRLHEIQFDGDYHHWHIDVCIMPLRPGLCIYNPYYMYLTPQFEQLLKQNDWEMIPAVPPTHLYDMRIGTLNERVGPYWISMNTLSIDPKTMCIEAHETGYQEQINKMGIEVIPVDYADQVAFGGSLHCSTVDIYREGNCEDYFPKQVEGY